jgi:hypothetical protein
MNAPGRLAMASCAVSPRPLDAPPQAPLSARRWSAVPVAARRRTGQGQSTQRVRRRVRGAPLPLEWGVDLATQVGELRAAGSRVETVFPDGGAGDVFDANALDPSTRRQAARGGYDQGRALAELLAEIWR